MLDWVGDIQQCVQGEGPGGEAVGGDEEGAGGGREGGGQRAVHGAGDRPAPPSRPPQHHPPRGPGGVPCPHLPLSLPSLRLHGARPRRPHCPPWRPVHCAPGVLSLTRSIQIPEPRLV